MIPICLVTGFLGSGKTTLLRRIIEQHRDEKIVYLVNEFSPLDIDGALLAQGEDDVIAIPGGSIFCTCLVTQFVGHLQQIPERFDTADEPVEGVVIEASGIANPMVVEQMLRETGLDGTYELASIVSIVDPGSLPKLVHTLPNLRAQIEAADAVLVNKIDLFPAEDVDATEGIVRGINPDATIVRTIRCGADLDLFGGARVRGLSGEYAVYVDPNPNYARYAVAFDGPVDLAELRAQLDSCRDELYRAKGVVPTEAGLFQVDVSEAGITAERVGDAAGEPALVLIARSERHGRVAALVARLQTPERG